MSSLISRDLDIPLYQQLSDRLTEAILNHVWNVGDRIPSENELIDAYRVSRTVVRAAISELVKMGLLRQVQGKGTFVIENRVIERNFQEFKGFFEQMEALGITPITSVLLQRVAPCSQLVGKKLNLPWGSEVFELERLRYIQDDPRYIVMNYIPFDLCPDLAEEDFDYQSLYKLMEKKYGIPLLSGSRSVSAVAADKRLSKLLGIKLNTPLVYIEGVSFSSEGKAVEYFQAYHRADKTVFTYEVRR